MSNINGANIEDPVAGASWENLDEKQIERQLSSLTASLNKLAEQIKRFVFDNDYTKTSELYDDCWIGDLSGDGWLLGFLNLNRESFADYLGGSKPDWYGAASAEERKTYDLCLQYYRELSLLKPSVDQLRSVMMRLPLLDGFRCVRFTLNFIDAGLDREYYDHINKDIEFVNSLIHWPWDRLDANARTAKQYYRDNCQRLGRAELEKGYRQARVRDYQNLVQTLYSGGSFRPHSDGVYSLDLNCVVLMEIIDDYTDKLSSLKDIEDEMKQAVEKCNGVLNGLNEVYGSLKNASVLSLVGGLRALTREIMEFADLAGTAYRKFKNKDDDDPYCYVKPLPVNSSLDGKYGLSAVSGDAMSNGTRFAQLYGKALDALNAHCHDFVYAASFPPSV